MYVFMITIIISYSTLIALVTYFVVGGIYMYKKKGARGLEVIPNYAFWKDLPFLIKVNGCMVLY